MVIFIFTYIFIYFIFFLNFAYYCINLVIVRLFFPYSQKRMEHVTSSSSANLLTQKNFATFLLNVSPFSNQGNPPRECSVTFAGRFIFRRKKRKKERKKEKKRTIHYFFLLLYFIDDSAARLQNRSRVIS